MKRRVCLWFALSNLSAGFLGAATRPHYGGTLTMNLSATFTTFEQSELPPVLGALVGETLVRINSRSEAEPCLAASWQREADGRRWRISLRNRIMFHDGELLTATAVASVLLPALKAKYGEVSITPGASTLVIQSDNPLPDLLSELSSPRTAIVRKTEANLPIGTGPFHVISWEPGRRLALAAFQDHWQGRPFLDSVVVNLSATSTSADIFDIPFASLRRILPETSKIWQSAPRELLALVSSDAPGPVVEALALLIDRAPIVNVLAQRRGEPAFGLLPQWLSGYEFLFSTAPDLTRARQLLSQAKLNPLTLGYAANDSFARAIAERIALNARDAGLVLQPVPTTAGALRLVRWKLQSVDAASELVSLARSLGILDSVKALDVSKPETLYEAERALLDSHRIIPLAHLPELYGIAPRVHLRDPSERNALNLRLQDLWVDP